MRFNLSSLIRGRSADDTSPPEVDSTPKYLPTLRRALVAPSKPVIKITWKGRSPRTYYVWIDGMQLVDSMNRARWFRAKPKAQEAADFTVAFMASNALSSPAAASRFEA